MEDRSMKLDAFFQFLYPKTLADVTDDILVYMRSEGYDSDAKEIMQAIDEHIKTLPAYEQDQYWRRLNG
jgi:hypothetical protein